MILYVVYSGLYVALSAEGKRDLRKLLFTLNDFKQMFQQIAHNLGLRKEPPRYGRFRFYEKFDFFFLHVKATDARGEDGDFDAKVAALEEIDAAVPEVAALNPDVLVMTGDHSTPAALAMHSWHPVPAMLRSECCRPDDVERFDEISCLRGGMGRMPMVHLISIALANARRLTKFGA